jgi:hypothetical protein
MWMLESPLAKQEELAAHLAWLTKEVKPYSAYLRDLSLSTKIDIFCSFTAIGDGGISLPASALSMPVGLGINLELSIVVLRD